MKLKLLAIGMLVAAMPVVAQTAGEGYNRISVSYANKSVSGNKYFGSFYNDKDKFSLNGIGVDYIHGFAVSSELPMFVETGLKLNTVVGSINGDKYEVDGKYAQGQMKARNMSLSIPVNFAYSFAIGDDMSLTPYIGLDFKFHLLGDYKYKVKTNISDDMLHMIGYSKDDLEGDWVNVFSKDNFDPTFHRFQMGWHIGVGFQYKPVYVGLSYGTDFIPLFKYEDAKVNTADFALSVGYCF